MGMTNVQDGLISYEILNKEIILRNLGKFHKRSVEGGDKKMVIGGFSRHNLGDKGREGVEIWKNRVMSFMDEP